MTKLGTKARDQWSFNTHFIGAILALIGTVYILIARRGEEVSDYITLILFGFSMIALYTCSSIYHYSNGSEEHIKRLRKLDHSMIYVLIAGSYTPILFNIMDYPKNIITIGAMWGLAIIGTIMKIFYMNAPRWLSTSLYVIMGWAIVFDFKALTSMPKTFLWYLIGGGVAYTFGAVLYVIKKPNFSKDFGFHEVFHLFIMLGTALNFVGICFYL